MANKKYRIDGFPYIEVSVSGKSVYATINLEPLNYTQDSLSVLLGSISKLKEVGFEKFNTSYNTGYYDSVEDISLEFNSPIDKINMKQFILFK